MAVPAFDDFIDPVLRYLATRQEGAGARDVYEAVADSFSLTETDRRALLPSGAQQVYKNRAGWAYDRLKRAGLASSPRRGWWQLTEKGLTFARSHIDPLPREEVTRLALVNRESRLKPRPEANASTLRTEFVERESPDDRLWGAFEELRASTAAEVLEAILAASPLFFERLVLDLLHAMGYGATQADLQHVGKSGDGGIDGIISLDRLGLEKVYVQAKRWQSPVPADPIQAFFGALAGRRAKKGVFITTSSYTKGAKDFAESVEGIVLVDGDRLCALMMEHGVGTTSQPISIPKIDRDYFED